MNMSIAEHSRRCAVRNAQETADRAVQSVLEVPGDEDTAGTYRYTSLSYGAANSLRAALSQLIDATHPVWYRPGVDACAYARQLVAALFPESPAEETALADTFEVRCVYCASSMSAEDETGYRPIPDDDAGWAEEASYHARGCEWVRTRAHSVAS